MLKISVIFFRTAVCLSPNAVSVILGVGLKREWVMSTATCVATSFDDIIGNVWVSGKKICGVKYSLFRSIWDV